MSVSKEDGSCSVGTRGVSGTAEDGPDTRRVNRSAMAHQLKVRVAPLLGQGKYLLLAPAVGACQFVHLAQQPPGGRTQPRPHELPDVQRTLPACLALRAAEVESD